LEGVPRAGPGDGRAAFLAARAPRVKGWVRSTGESVRSPGPFGERRASARAVPGGPCASIEVAPRADDAVAVRDGVQVAEPTSVEERERAGPGGGHAGVVAAARAAHDLAGLPRADLARDLGLLGILRTAGGGRELTPVGCPRGAGDVREGLAIRLDDTVPAAPVVVHRIAVVAVFPGAPESVAALDAAVGGAGVVVDVVSVVAVFDPEVHVAIPAHGALAV